MSSRRYPRTEKKPPYLLMIRTAKAPIATNIAAKNENNKQCYERESKIAKDLSRQ